MAITRITITCDTCGGNFEHRHESRNRRDADSYELWAIKNITTCPTCRRKAASESASAALNAALANLGITLPQIEGVSDKQVAYAQSVRDRILSADLRAITEYHRGMSSLQDPDTLAKTRAVCEAHGITLEEGIERDLKRCGLYRVHIAMTSTSAREILDKLGR